MGMNKYMEHSLEITMAVVCFFQDYAILLTNALSGSKAGSFFSPSPSLSPFNYLFPFSIFFNTGPLGPFFLLKIKQKFLTQNLGFKYP